MRLGSAELHLISDGTFRMDGGAMFGAVPKAIWGKFYPADRENRVALGLNCLLIRTGGRNVLVDTGLGTKHGRKTRTIFRMQAGQLANSLAAWMCVLPRRIPISEIAIGTGSGQCQAMGAPFATYWLVR